MAAIHRAEALFRVYQFKRLSFSRQAPNHPEFMFLAICAPCMAWHTELTFTGSWLCLPPAVRIFSASVSWQEGRVLSDTALHRPGVSASRRDGDFVGGSHT